MKNYLHKKYRERLRTSIVIFPMFLNVGSVAPACLSRSYHDGKPAVIYAGGLQKWQQVDKMIDAISRTVSMCAHHFYCPDPDSVRKMLPQAIRSQIIIDRKTHAELKEIYTECHYGFILREDSIVNQVACPTKLVEYLAMGVVPIVDSNNIGDFKTMGMRFITLEQLLQGNLPNEMERIKMVQDNCVVYEHLRNIRNRGEQEICAMLAGTQRMEHSASANGSRSIITSLKHLGDRASRLRTRWSYRYSEDSMLSTPRTGQKRSDNTILTKRTA